MLYILRSRDYGETWKDASLVAKGFNEFSLCKANGKLIAVIRSDKNELYVTCSNDKGYTWSKPIKIGNQFEHPADIIKLSNDSLLVVFGYRRFPFGIRAIVSRDSDKSWSKERIVLVYDAIGEDYGYPSIVIANDEKLL
jgi:Neuraminidase (sialidase)